MNLFQVRSAYQLTSGIANGVWESTSLFQTGCFGPFYNVIYLKNHCFSPLNDFTTLSSNQFVSWTCNGAYYATPLALKGIKCFQHLQGKDTKAIEKIEYCYKTILLSLYFFSAIRGIRKASLNNKPLEALQFSGVLMGATVGTLIDNKMIAKESISPLLNRIWWIGVILSFFQGKGLSGGFSLLFQRFTSTLQYYILGSLAEVPSVIVMGLSAAIAIKTGKVTIHPLLKKISEIDLTDPTTRERIKTTVFREVTTNDLFNRTLSEEQKEQTVQLIEDCFQYGIVEQAIAICGNRNFQDQCQTIIMKILNNASSNRLEELKEGYSEFLNIPELYPLITAFAEHAAKAPDLLPSFQVEVAFIESKIIYDPLSPQLKEAIASGDVEMMNHFIELLIYRYAFGEKGHDPIPGFFTKDTRRVIAELRSSALQNQNSIQWIKTHRLDNFDPETDISDPPQEHKEFVNLFRQSVSKEIQNGIIIKKVWLKLTPPDQTNSTT